MATGWGDFLSPGSLFGNAFAILGGFSGSRQSGWDRAMLVNLLNALNAYSQYGIDRANDVFGPLRQAGLGMLEGLPGYAYDAGDFYTRLGSLAGMFENLPWSDRATTLSPELQSIMQQQLGLIGAASPSVDVGNWLLSTDNNMLQAGQGVLDLGSLMLGLGTPEQQAMLGLAGQFTQGGGMTDALRQAQAAGLGLLQGGGLDAAGREAQGVFSELLRNMGVTPEARQALERGYGLMDFVRRTGGMTSGLEDAAALGRDILANRGMTPELAALAQRGAELSAQNPLMSDEALMSLVMNRAATERAQAAEALMRKAQARGGGPSVISGLQADKLSEFEDEILRASADALAKALQEQQGLKLQQLQQGLGALSRASEGAADRERIGATLNLTPEQIAASRWGTGLNVGGDLAGRGLAAATQLIGTSGSALTDLGRLGLAGIGTGADIVNNVELAALRRAGLGTDLYNALLSSRNVGGGLTLGAMRGIGDMFETGSNMALRGLQSQLGGLGAAAGTFLSGQNLNLDRIDKSMLGMLGAYRLMPEALKARFDLINLGTGTLGDMGRSWLNALTSPGIHGIGGLRTPGMYDWWSAGARRG